MQWFIDTGRCLSEGNILTPNVKITPSGMSSTNIPSLLHWPCVLWSLVKLDLKFTQAYRSTSLEKKRSPFGKVYVVAKITLKLNMFMY